MASRFFGRMLPTWSLFDDDCLRPHIVAVDKAQHIHARRHSVCRDAIYRVSRQNDAPHHIHHLQHAFAVDDDVAIAEEGKGIVAIIVVVCVPANEHEAETANSTN